jgi:hypothetical protein
MDWVCAFGYIDVIFPAAPISYSPAEASQSLCTVAFGIAILDVRRHPLHRRLFGQLNFHQTPRVMLALSPNLGVSAGE